MTKVKQSDIQIKRFCEECGTRCVISFSINGYRHTDGSPVWNAFSTCPNAKWWNSFLGNHDKNTPIDDEGYELFESFDIL